MEIKEMQKYQLRADILKALSHPSRLFIVDMLSEKEHCVCDITKKIESDISTVSRHLDKLKQAGIIERRKEGTMVIYTLQMQCLSGISQCVENVLKQKAEKLSALI